MCTALRAHITAIEALYKISYYYFNVTNSLLYYDWVALVLIVFRLCGRCGTWRTPSPWSGSRRWEWSKSTRRWRKCSAPRRSSLTSRWRWPPRPKRWRPGWSALRTNWSASFTQSCARDRHWHASWKPFYWGINRLARSIGKFYARNPPFGGHLSYIEYIPFGTYWWGHFTLGINCLERIGEGLVNYLLQSLRYSTLAIYRLEEAILH